MQKKYYPIYLTEVTLLTLTWHLILGRPICILGCYSYFQNHGGILQKIATKLHGKRLVNIVDDFKELFPYKDNGDFQRLTNAFSESEPWMEKQFKMDSLTGSYALAIKHIISNRSFALYQRNYDLFYLKDILVTPSLDEFDKSFYSYAFKESLPVKFFEPILKYLLNFSLFILSLIQCILWIISRIRFAVTKYEIALATDYNGGTRDMKFWDFLSPDRKKTLVVVRDSYTRKTFKHLLTGYNVVFDIEGTFDIKGGFLAWIESFRDAIWLFINHCQLPPDYYRQICFLPVKRMKYRALFNKYNCSVFWGRDDYNYQHIMRSQEVRRIGGISIGCNHGIQSIVTTAYQLRYLDFDYYYMHGIDQYTTYYSKYWPSHMIAKGVGSMFSNPQQHALIRGTVGTDVAIIVAPSFHQDIIFDAVISLVKQFPDLVFWISTKAKHRFDGTFGKKYQALVYAGFSNVNEYTEDVYDLFPRCKYLFSESSTLLAEALYFDRVTLCFDPVLEFKFLYYRKFPELVFKDVNALANRIKETRNITVHYSDPNLKNLIFRGSEHPWEIIKKTLLIESLNKSRQTTGS